MIGVDISDRSIKIVELAGPDTMYVRTVGWSPLPSGYIRRGVIQDIPAVTAALVETFSRCSPQPLADGQVVASIPETKSFVRVIDLPTMSDSEIDEAVQWAVRKHIPFDLERVYLDWQKLPQGTLPGGRHEILVGAVQRDVVDPLLDVLDRAGLSVAALELEAQALVRSLLPLDSREIRGVLIIDVGATFTDIVFFDNGVMRFTTSIPMGGDDLTAALVREFKLDPSVAEQQKVAVGVAGAAGDAAAISAVLRTGAVAMFQKIDGVVRDISGQARLQDFVRTILLSGGSANLPGLEQVLSEVLPGIPVQRGNPWINITTPAEQKSVALPPDSATHFVTALGLALRPSEENQSVFGSREINLLPVTRRYFLNRQRVVGHLTSVVRSFIAALLVVTASGLIAAGVLQTLVLLSSQARSANLQQEIDRYQTLRDGIARQNITLELMHTLSTNRVVWSEILPDLFTRVPSGVFIARMGGHVNPAPQFSFNGRAANRNVLLSLRERLQGIPWVQGVSAPHTNLIEPINPAYTFDVTVAQEAAEETP